MPTQLRFQRGDGLGSQSPLGRQRPNCLPATINQIDESRSVQPLDDISGYAPQIRVVKELNQGDIIEPDARVSLTLADDCLNHQSTLQKGHSSNSNPIARERPIGNQTYLSDRGPKHSHHVFVAAFRRVPFEEPSTQATLPTLQRAGSLDGLSPCSGASIDMEPDTSIVITPETQAAILRAA
jgi:hypothetical protein